MNRNRDITAKICNAALALAAFAALSGCAAIGNPDGGPYDETPPRITNSHPDNGATGVKTKKVSIDFNEFIKLENANENVVISPPQIQQPEIKVTGKKIQVEFFDSLKANTTYSIDFADGIKDNNEGNPLGNFCFRFSTGDVIDSLEVSGYVLNAEDLEPIKGMTVGLHSDLEDSAFMTKPFERVSRTDAYGHFTIRGIAPGTYRIFAVMDMDQTFSYSQRNEKIAWMDSLIVPSAELRYRVDTLFTSEGKVDTTVTVPYIKYLPDDITLLAFTPKPVIQYMTAAERLTHEKFTLRFALPLDSMPQVKGINFDETDAYIVQSARILAELVQQTGPLFEPGLDKQCVIAAYSIHCHTLLGCRVAGIIVYILAHKIFISIQRILPVADGISVGITLCPVHKVVEPCRHAAPCCRSQQQHGGDDCNNFTHSGLFLQIYHY